MILLYLKRPRSIVFHCQSAIFCEQLQKHYLLKRKRIHSLALKIHMQTLMVTPPPPSKFKQNEKYTKYCEKLCKLISSKVSN